MHPLRFQRLQQILAVLAHADAADQRDLGAEPRRGHRLVAALAAGRAGEGLADQGLARRGQAHGVGHEVHVDAAHHHHGGRSLC